MIDFAARDDAELARHVETNRRVPRLAPALVVEQADEVLIAHQWATHDHGQLRSLRVRVRCNVCRFDIGVVIDHGRLHEGVARSPVVEGQCSTPGCSAARCLAARCPAAHHRRCATDDTNDGRRAENGTPQAEALAGA